MSSALAEQDVNILNFSLLNRLLRTGLDALEEARKREPPIIPIEPRNPGRRKYPSLDEISEVLAAAEGDTFT